MGSGLTEMADSFHERAALSANDHSDPDAIGAIAAAAYLMALNQLVVNVQPLVLGALADDLKLSNGQIGTISATFIGATTACALLAPLWVRRVNWRIVTSTAVVAATGILVFGSRATDYVALLIVFGVVGLLKGVLGPPAFASLGDATNPVRAFAASTGAQSLAAAVATAALSTVVIPHWGANGAFLTLAAVTATGFVAIRWLPAHGRTRVERTREPSPGTPILSVGALPAFVGLIAVAMMTSAILGYWVFVERIGSAQGISTGLIGASLVACALASTVSAAGAAWLSARWSDRSILALGVALLLSSFALIGVRSTAAYLSANLLFALGWGVVTPAYFAMLRKSDRTNRLFPAGPAAGGLGGVAIGLVAGPIIEAAGFVGLVAVSGAILALSALLIVAAERAAAGMFGRLTS